VPFSSLHKVSGIRNLALSSTFEGEEDFEVVERAGLIAEARRILADLGLPDGYGADLIEELQALVFALRHGIVEIT
jgi:hypothetical protein